MASKILKSISGKISNKIDMSKLNFHTYLRIIFFKTLMILKI